MGAIPASESKTIYYKIVNDKDPFRVKVKPGTRGAIKREFTPLNSDTPVVMYELRFSGLEGILVGISREQKTFKNGGKAMVIAVHLKDVDPNEPDMVLNLNFETNSVAINGLLEKLMNTQVGEPIQIKYYGFKDENGESVRVFVVRQGDYSSDESKVYSKFWDPQAKQSLHGIPHKTKEDRQYMTSTKWKAHFEEVNDFLMQYYANVMHQSLVAMVETGAADVSDIANSQAEEDYTDYAATAGEDVTVPPPGPEDVDEEDLPF